MPKTYLIALIPLLPLLSFLLAGLFGRRYLKSFAGYLGTFLLAVSCGLAIYTAWSYFQVYSGTQYPRLTPVQLTWLRFSDNLSIDMGILLDPISVMMLVVVTLVSLMVHLYSLGYMKGETRFATYYAYLGLFSFSMLGLVMASNLFQTYIFWELVGVSSFLLIGYYYDKPSAVAASKKAFIVTRFADLGFLIGILVLSSASGTFDFNSMIKTLTDPTTGNSAASASFLGISVLSWGTALVFIGGAAKSAMFPLHIWLPDAMEGPTPVSALIHAATMVVAGVYLVARLFPIYAINTPAVLDIIAWVGAISAIFAAIIACTQTDIKRVLAYSTMSQIGYMMFALGVSSVGGENGLGYTASMFHLFTHAMFKALLFLGAGAVIHYVHSNEIKDMGGLRKYMPLTHITFLVACLAIAGIPPFAGFFSKEEILLAASHHNTAIYWIALFTSGLTAFYMFRLYFGIFWNKPYASHTEAAHDTHHGNTASMNIPLLVLAAGAVFAGFLPFAKYVTADGKPLESHMDIAFSILPVALGITGILLAAWMYARTSQRPEKAAGAFGRLYRAANKKFYIDEIYLFITKKVLFNLVGRPAAWIDRHLVDGAVNLVGSGTQKVSAAIRKMQSGKVQAYALYFLAAAIVLAVLFIYILN